ncbi:unnamed protein product [Adineta steineri]|uniref:G-protein coupled receptors family 1 profile domain-containing protein n=1 Tax=Adineta steineri TaxID=433720 RepID=A0A815SCU9_9BILA|nr:unnamed protein product [Adineta steineri]CAF1490423.1 unnamed protein product [Adineta steineri]CAF3758167.1 unnamed protein product [Adineta steineri]CAF4050608.1 unnamed protein product [Adineta steineri]
MFTVLASVDTFTMTSSKQTYHVFSQPAVAVKCSIDVIFCCPFIGIDISITNTIVDDQFTMPCVYTWIFVIYQTLITSILPSLAMIIFSCLAYFIMKKIGTQYNHILNLRKRQQQSQLVRKITTQVFVYIISTELNSISTFYKQLIANLLNHLSYLLHEIVFCISIHGLDF